MSMIRSIPVLRALAWRLGRKLYCAARGELTNDPSRNGEYWLLEQVLGRPESRAGAILLDVGANKGDWSAEAIRLTRGARDISVHAFEPSTPTRELLSNRLTNAASMRIHSFALSDADGESVFYSDAPGGGHKFTAWGLGPQQRNRAIETP